MATDFVMGEHVPKKSLTFPGSFWMFVADRGMESLNI